ncbi:tetratricopeptide repeat protein, partial [Craurococcus roseus]|uniref:tetratricopeptide repeat protein n=1 Tax=Craurococcus roseus TaxID=77585 RepID=UPI0031DAE61E
RTAERAIAEGQAALNRRDYAAAEAAAREALAARNSPRAADAQMLLADALAGKRDNAGAALAYNDAYTRARNSPRAPDALLGLANAFTNLGHKREACDTLDDLRSNFPNLRQPQAERAAETRRRAGCR